MIFRRDHVPTGSEQSAEVSARTVKQPGKLRKRILAGFLAFVLLLGIFLNGAIQIRFARLEYLGTVLEHAATVTEENTEYLNESSLKRAWNILRYAVGKPKTYDEYDMYTSLAIARTEYGEAIQYMQGCIDLYPGDSSEELGRLYLRLGSLYALTEKSDEAIRSFDKALELVDDMEDAYLLRSQMHSVLGNTEASLADIRRYDELAGENPAISPTVGALYESAGDYEGAASAYTVGIEQTEKPDPELLASRARCYLLLGEMDKAQRDILRFFNEGGTDPNGEKNIMLGICRMEGGDYEKALQSFHKGMEAGYSQTALIYSQCVLCAYIIGDYATVIADGEKALAVLEQGETPAEAQPIVRDEELMTAEELHHWIGLARMAGEDFAGAKEEFLKIEDTAKAPEGVLYYLGLCSASQGENKEAADYYTKSIEKEEMTSLCYYNRGVSYLQMEDLEAGLTDLITVLQRSDDESAVTAAQTLLEELGVEVVIEK